jgi:aminopeptidase
MTDPRTHRLAEILVHHSAGVRPGQWVVIRASLLAEPLAERVVAEVLRAGGNPTVELSSDGIAETLLRGSTEEQLSWVSPVERLPFEHAHALILIDATSNTRALSEVEPGAQRAHQLARGDLREIRNRRAAAGEMAWAYTQYPCPAYAQEAGMSLRDYQDFVYRASFADQPDPVSRWRTVHDEQQRIVDWLFGRKRVELRGPNVALEFSIEGRRFVNADGRHNLPDGEVFTGPVEDSAEGWVRFDYPAIKDGRLVDGVRLELRQGQVVEATATRNPEFLLEMLDSDPGARFLGEFAIGTNDRIDRFTGNILFDEKLGGTIHLALGNGYPETGSVNRSSLHWDMICDMRDDGEILVDGEVLYRDGEFQV